MLVNVVWLVRVIRLQDVGGGEVEDHGEDARDQHGNKGYSSGNRHRPFPSEMIFDKTGGTSSNNECIESLDDGFWLVS